MRITALAPACLLSGCIPVVTPPVQMSAAGGAMPVLRADPDGPPGLWNVRVSVHPADLARDAHRLPVDLGIGYTRDSRSWLGSRIYAQGAYFQLGYYPWVRPLGKDVAARFGPFASVDALSSGGGWGWGMSVGLAMGLDVHVHGCTSDQSMAACGRGLAGGKLLLQMQVREVDGMRYVAPMIGFGLTQPASVGIVGVGSGRWR